MKKLTLAMTISLAVCLAASILTNAAEVDNLCNKLIRIHIIANSDSEYDQAVKMSVRNTILNICDELTCECENKSQAMSKLSENLEYIETAAHATLLSLGCNSKVSCTLSKVKFPDRVYSDYTLPSGVYDALRICIGEAKGQNFWCICYPSLCIGTCSSVEETGVFSQDEITVIKHPEKVKYKLFCFKLIGKIKSLFV